MRFITNMAGAALVLLGAPVLHAATYYVGKANCGGTAGTTAAQPLCSIQAGVNKLQAGDKLIVADGVYNEIVTVKASGSATAPIVIEGPPGAKAILDGSGKSLDEQGVLNIEQRAHITIRNLTIRKSSFYCLHVVTSQHVIIERNIIDGCRHGGIVADQGSAAISVLDNEVKGTDQCGQSCGIHEAITMSDVNGFVVANNNVHHGIKEGIDAKDGSKNGEIYNNHIHDMGQVGLYLNHCTNVTVRDNRIHHNGSSGIQIGVGDYAMGTPNTTGNKIFRNLSYANAYCGIELWAEGGGNMGNNLIHNNVLVQNKHYGIQLSDQPQQAAGNRVHNNILVGNQLGGIVGSATKVSTISHNLFHQSGSLAGAASISGDPLFVNAAAGDFHLKSGSPAIDKGVDLGLQKVGAPDLGAFEYGLGQTPLPPPPPSTPPTPPAPPPDTKQPPTPPDQGKGKKWQDEEEDEEEEDEEWDEEWDEDWEYALERKGTQELRGGCSAGGGNVHSNLPLGLLLVLAALWRRRRR